MKSHISDSELSHDRIKDIAVSFFRDKGFTVVSGIRVRTWKPDIVAVKGDTVIIAEVKGPYGDLRKALAQVALYATDATSAYLAIPATLVDMKLKQGARALGVGLIGVGDRAVVAVQPSIGLPRPAFLRRAKMALERRDRKESDAGRRRPPPLHRILRTRSVVDALLSNRERRFTIRELSIEARTPYSTTRRAVMDLVSLGAIRSERVGPSEYLALNPESPLLAELSRLLSVNLSPHRAAASEFARLLEAIPDVRKVVLFGSVAEGKETTGSDIDVAVFLSAKTKEPMQRISDAVAEVQDRIRMNIAPLVMTARSRPRSQLAQAIEAGEVLFERH